MQQQRGTTCNNLLVTSAQCYCFAASPPFCSAYSRLYGRNYRWPSWCSCLACLPSSAESLLWRLPCGTGKSRGGDFSSSSASWGSWRGWVPRFGPGSPRPPFSPYLFNMPFRTIFLNRSGLALNLRERCITERALCYIVSRCQSLFSRQGKLVQVHALAHENGPQKKNKRLHPRKCS